MTLFGFEEEGHAKSVRYAADRRDSMVREGGENRKADGSRVDFKAGTPTAAKERIELNQKQEVGSEDGRLETDIDAEATVANEE